LRARYYDPLLGRFVSEDPIGLSGGVNPYVYAHNDPVNLTDPTGLDPCYRNTRTGEVHCPIPLRGVRVRGRSPYHHPRSGWGMEHGASAYEAALAEWETEQFLAFWHYEWEQAQQGRGEAREWVSDNQQCLAASGGAALSVLGDFAFGGAAKLAWGAGRTAARYGRLAHLAEHHGSRISYMDGPFLDATQWAAKAAPSAAQSNAYAFTAGSIWAASAERKIMTGAESIARFVPFVGSGFAIYDAVTCW
jgi:uncharacterized protein RhaS with RHS repeats